MIQQHNSDYLHLSYAYAQIFHGAWLEERLFPIMELQPGVKYEGLNIALERARRRGADLLILGSVPYFYAGHTLDDTAITIKIDIYSAGNGNLLWTMMQSGRIEDKLPDDYIYFRHEYRLSEGPFNKIIRTLAKDMAIPLKAWLPDPDTDYQFADNAEGVTTNLVSGQGITNEEAREDGADLPKEGDDTKADDENVQRPQVNGVNLNIEFDFDKDTIRDKSLVLLDALGEALSSQELKGKNVIIGGHTDTRGSEEVNLALSKKRADAVKKYLVNKWGIDPNTIEAVEIGRAHV